ncbi:MAG: SDR family oxidoreductase [Bacteroidetes Order II. Incertae sedis bacterium]|nr:SDR family oxidoreductase [Bacteroidetes Order II. bacterium]
MSDLDLINKTVVITGAGTPLGRVIVERFAQTGATLVAVFDTIDEAYERFPQQIEGWVLAADLSDEVAAQSCFGKIAEKFEHLDVLIHAAHEWERRPIDQMSYEDWDRVLRKNLYAAFLSFRESLRMMKTGPGRLIAVTGQQGADKARAQMGALAAAQAGIIRLVEATAAEYAKLDISVFAIAPSIVLTEKEGKHGVWAGDIADLCIHLCRPESKALTGAVLRAYGTVQ